MEYKNKSVDTYYAVSDSDRFQSFITNSKQIMKLLYRTDYNPAIAKRNFTEKLTKYPEEGNLEYIKNQINQNNGAKNLIIAPTGSGKTYSIDAIFKQLTAESNEKQILCLLCPNRVQNIQNEQSDDYSFEALIEGIHLEENDQGIRQISAVYDKIPEIQRYKKEHPECRLRVVIDECHNLISANTFRETAIDAIMKLINDRTADSYTFITATYESLCCLPFDSITLFEDKDYKPVFQSVELRYAQKGDFDNLVIDTALKENKPYIRLNSKQKIESIKKFLSDKGLDCHSVTADDKGYVTNEDGTVSYKNTIFDHITKHDDLYNNEGEADVILTTSLLDAGTNFTKYSPESTPVFAVSNPLMMNMDEIEQAFNRFRPQKDASGNVIRLDHAVILQELPRPEISSIRIMQYQEGGTYTKVGSIPPKAVTYNDRTTPEEIGQGIYNATVTIPGIHLAGLEDGIYMLEFVIGRDIGRQEGLVQNRLYVNYSIPDIHSKGEDEIKAGEETLANLRTGLADGTMSIIDITDRLSSLLSSLTSDSDFIYNTGDESVSAKMMMKPFPLCDSLANILKAYLDEAKQQLKNYHNYKASSNTDESPSALCAPGTDISITLPSLSMKPVCSYVSISRENNENVVSISCPSGGRISFAYEGGKELISIKNTADTLSVSVIGAKYPGNGAMTETAGKELKIIPVSSMEDAEKENWHYDKADIPPASPVTIIDTINNVRIILASNIGTINSGMTRDEYLDSLLNRLKKENPAIGNALYRDSKSDRLFINYQKLFNGAYSAYQNRNYYYPKRLMDGLQGRLNIPVSISYYTPSAYKMEAVEEDRDKLLNNLNLLYNDPAIKDILCNVLHFGKRIPSNLEAGQRKMLSEIQQSRLYKEEYKALLNICNTLTFDYIIKVLNFAENEKATRKHIKRLEYMVINQGIRRGEKLAVYNKRMQKQFNEQKRLIDIINDMRASSGTKNFTINESFMKSTLDEYNKRLKASNPKNKEISNAQLDHLLQYVYVIRKFNSRKPELMEPILSVEDVPFK